MKNYSLSLSISCLVTLLLPLVNTAGAADEEFKASAFRFEVFHYTDATKAALEAQGEKRAVQVNIKEECSMEDFAKVCDHAWIKKLELHDGAPLITSFEPLSKLTALEELAADSLEASGESPFDLQPLAQLTNLEALALDATSSENFAALANLSKLERLGLRMTGVDSLEFLSGCTNLEIIDLYGKSNTFPNYDALAGLKNLKTLVIDGNAQATDENLAILSSLTNLESVSMKDCDKATSLNFLKGSVAKLKRLTIVNCGGLSDIAVLNETVSLETLLAIGLPVEDLSFLSKMPDLKTLNLLKVKIDDLSVFAGLSKLGTLYLSRDMVPGDAEEKLKTMLPELKPTIR